MTSLLLLLYYDILYAMNLLFNTLSHKFFSQVFDHHISKKLRLQFIFLFSILILSAVGYQAIYHACEENSFCCRTRFHYGNLSRRQVRTCC